MEVMSKQQAVAAEVAAAKAAETVAKSVPSSGGALTITKMKAHLKRSTN